MKHLSVIFSSCLCICMLAQVSAASRESIPVKGATLNAVLDEKLGKGWRDSEGVTWFEPLKGGNGEFLTVHKDVAARMCEELGARLPKRFQDLGRLYYFFDAGSNEYDKFDVPEELGYLRGNMFWFQNFNGAYAVWFGNRNALAYSSEGMVICVKD